MGRKTKLGLVIATGLLLVLFGVVVALCSTPIFSHTTTETFGVPKSETIMNYSFAIHRSQDKMVQFQLRTDQRLNVLAEGNGVFNFSIANFTDTAQAIQPDQPDITYRFVNDTTLVNTTYSSPIRTPQTGNYYLIFLARDASPDYPVQIYANVTKTWTDFQSTQVEAADRISLIEPKFVYVGAAMTILGILILLFTLRLDRRPRRRKTRS